MEGFKQVRDIRFMFAQVFLAVTLAGSSCLKWGPQNMNEHRHD